MGFFYSSTVPEDNFQDDLLFEIPLIELFIAPLLTSPRCRNRSYPRTTSIQLPIIEAGSQPYALQLMIHRVGALAVVLRKLC